MVLDNPSPSTHSRHVRHSLILVESIQRKQKRMKESPKPTVKKYHPPKCEYCEKDATYRLDVCDVHLKVLDQVATRRKKK